VDFDLKFTYVLAGWEGSAHNASILNDSLKAFISLKVSSTLEMQVTLVEQGDIQAWKNKRNVWAQAMWAHRTDVFYD
jgi:hypothetical protein